MKLYSVLMSHDRLSLGHVLSRGEFCTYCRHRMTNHSLARQHDHDFFELFWVESGPGIHYIHDEKRIVEAGTLQLIRPEDRHTFAAIPGSVFELTNVTLVTETWQALRARYFKEPVYFDLLPWQDREFRGLTGYIGDLRAAAASLHAGRRDRLSLERFLLNALALLPDGRTPETPIPGWVVALRDDLRQQANFVSGVAQVVKTTGRCSEHVCREFRRFYGKTPTDEMNDARLLYAAVHLRSTSIKIVDLALDLGIENLGYFYRLFSRHFGCTPAEYRRAHAASAMDAVALR